MTIHGILETCLYCSDLNRAESFYSNILGLELVSRDNNRHIFYHCGNSMLLIFNPEHTSNEQTYVNDYPIPLHGAKGAGHVAFSVDESDLTLWKDRLAENNVPIESEVIWPNGQLSLYFRDPGGNSLELVNPGIWE